MPFGGVESLFLCGGKVREPRDEEKYSVAKIAEMDLNKIKQSPVTKTKTSILREEMNAGKGVKVKVKKNTEEEGNEYIRIRNMEQKREIKSLQEYIKELRIEIDTLEKNEKSKFEEITASGFYIDVNQQKYIVINEEEEFKREENLCKLEEKLNFVESDKSKLALELKELKKVIENFEEQIHQLEKEQKMAESNLKDEIKINEDLKENLNKTEEELTNEREEVEKFCKMYKEKLHQYEVDQDTLEKENKELLNDLKVKVDNAEELEFNNLNLNDMVVLISNLEVEKSKHEEDLLKLKKEMEETKNNCKTLEIKNSELMGNNTELDETIIELNESIKKSSNEKENAENQFQNEVEILKNEICTYSVNQNGYENDLKKQNLKIEEQEASINENGVEINRKSILIAELEEKIKNLENEILILTKEIMSLNEENKINANKFHNENNMLTSQIKEKEMMLEKLVLQIKEDKQDIKTLENKLIGLEQARKKLEEQNDSLVEQDKSKQDELNELKLKIKEFENIISRKENEISALQKSSNETEGFFQQENTLLKSNCREKEEKRLMMKNNFEELSKAQEKSLKSIEDKNTELKGENKKLKNKLNSLSLDLKEQKQNTENLTVENDKNISSLTEINELNETMNTEINELRKVIDSFTDENEQLKNERIQMVNENKQAKALWETEKEDFLKNQILRDQKFEKLTKDFEEQKKEQGDILLEKIGELKELQSELDMIDNIIAKKDIDLRMIKEELKELKKESELKLEQEQQNYKQKLGNEKERMQQEFDDQITELEVYHEQSKYEQIEELKIDYEKKNNRIKEQRDELVTALKNRTQVLTSDILNNSEIESLKQELHAKNAENGQLRYEISSNEKLIKFMSDFIEHDRINRTGSNQEILSTLNHIIVKMNEKLPNGNINNTYYGTLSSNDSFDSLINRSTSSCKSFSPELNTTWPSTKFYNPTNSRRSFDSLLSNQNTLKENIDKLKSDITLKLQDLQNQGTNGYALSKSVDHLSNSTGRESNLNTTPRLSNPNISSNLTTNIYYNKQLEVVDNKFKELNQLSDRLKEEEHPNDKWSENLEVWKKRSQYRFYVLQSSLNNRDVITTPYSLTKSIVFRPSNEEVQTIIKSVNEKYVKSS